MDEFDQIEAEYMEQHPALAPPSMQMQVYPLATVPQYPLAQVPANVVASPEPLLQRRIVGVPVWGWGLGVIGAGLAYYFLSKNGGKVEANPSVEATSGSDDQTASAPGWKTSRTEFGNKLQPWLQKHGLSDKTTVYIDADMARKKLKQVSPLVTIQCKGVRIPIKELDKFARREGLSAVEHGDGVVGFYPGGGKKGKAWEQYIDDLREEGQEV